MHDGNSIETLREILHRYRRVAVVGLSANWYRPSFFAAKYLIDHGYEVLPVNPAYAEVLGRRCYPDLRQVPGRVEVVDIFRRAEEVPALVEQAIEIGAKVVWMQLGVVHEEAAERARGAGLQVVMDRCMKIEYARLFGGLNFIGVNTRVISAKRPRVLPH
ncbi:CoA-binding protein [Alkalilimnicola sp. S0819]|nr:CoA-binding protein [Alkalilimnicola sp. S0819]MPQ16849.1 CoA-binding protein [Alkalilimnicola sp. S0819]